MVTTSIPFILDGLARFPTRTRRVPVSGERPSSIESGGPPSTKPFPVFPV